MNSNMASLLQAVLPFIIELEISLHLLKISLNDLEISLNDLDISLSHL